MLRDPTEHIGELRLEMLSGHRHGMASTVGRVEAQPTPAVAAATLRVSLTLNPPYGAYWVCQHLDSPLTSEC